MTGWLACSPCAAQPADPQIAATLNGFYRVHQQSSQDGIPDVAQRAKYEPYISPVLDNLLADAEAADARFKKANPDSPPMIEGDLFSPNFEGITSFQIGACAVKGDSAQCKMQLHYAVAHPAPQDKPVDWADTVSLLNTSAGWRVDDVAFGGHWDFGNHGTLKALLKDSIANANN
ncbi:MAG TPA: hypothetical protein VGM17_12750 [Rhizomicrobium sp.]|jgi:hypothetical protein